MATRNIKLTISYDGLNYSGWQNQPGKNTIQGCLQQSLGELTGTFIKINGASRTDAGVSALGQVANFLIDSPIPTKNFVKTFNHRLPRDIVVTEAVEVDKDFDASSSAKCKLYRYTIFTGKNRNVLKTRNCWHRSNPLDIAAMDVAAKMLLGTKDFKSFASAADKRTDSIRTILRCEVYSSKSPFSITSHEPRVTSDEWVFIDIEADRFLYNMVRNIVGTLVEVGREKWKPEKIDEILEAKDRKAAGPIAPAAGLCLMWIKY